MSQVFVSYSHQDAGRAKAIAKALQTAGHEVWWDGDIRGGTRFGKEIDQALRKADAVVVLWSSSSIESAWVQDEAAEGRDSDRLIPLLINDCKPPLGFRQYQSIDLTGWTGRRPLPASLIDAISAKSSAGVARPVQTHQTGIPWRSRLGLVVAMLLLASLLFGAWTYFSRTHSSSDTIPTLAVLPFADLSPGQDKGYFAEGVAESILSLLGREPGIRVIGRTSASMFKDRAGDLEAMRKSLGITHVLEGSARTSGDDLRMSVRLINASDGAQVWAEDYQQKLSNVFAVQDEIGKAVATKLLGSLSPARMNRSQITRADAYDLYLATRAVMRNRREPTLRKALGMARRVIAADPDYAPGHAIFAELVVLLSDDPYSYGDIPSQRASAVAIRHARKALELAPNSAEGHAALGFVLPAGEGVEPLRRAIRLDPVRAELRAWLALHLATLGRTREAIKEVEAGAEIDPLSTVPINRLHGILVASGEFKRAENVVRQYVARGGEPAQAARFRTVQARVSGDLSEAVAQARLAMGLNPDVPYVRQFLEGLAATLGVPQLVTWPPERNRRFIWLLAKGDKAKLLLEARSANSTVWTKPDSATAFLALAEARDWPQIGRLYVERGTAAAALCKERTGAIIPTAMALERLGKRAESIQLLACLDREIKMQARGSNGPDLTNRNEHEFTKAQLAALRGDHQAALDALERSIQLGWRGYPYSPKLNSYPALEPLQSSLGFAKIQKRLDRLLTNERQELIRLTGPRSAVR